MHDWLTARARTTPAALALIVDRKQWTYAGLEAEVTDYAAHLAAMGVRPGQRVGVLLPNGLAYVCLVHALVRLGAVLVPLNTRLAPPEVSWQVQKAGCEWLLYGEATAEQAQAAAVEGCTLVDAGRLALKPPPAAPPPATPFALERLQAIVFTSGTSGRPKGAMLTFANHFWSATASAFRLGIRPGLKPGLNPGDRWLSCLPLYHVGGLAVLFRSCLYGTVVILQDGFDLEAFNDGLDRHEATLTSLVPTMLYRLLPARAAWPASLRLVLVGGAATPPELVARCTEASVPLATTYGLTEAASQVATMLPAEVREKPGSVGKPLMFTEVRIVDEEGQSLPRGETGEIAATGPTVMAGYYDDAQATAQTLVDGELRTGDIGALDEEGDLWLVQRRSDVIVSGGENVYPSEVENVLRQHGQVNAACVVGLSHPEWGQQVAAMVALSPGQRPTEDQLSDFCRRTLAGYKVPRHWYFVERLPQTASGKVARKVVQEWMSQAVKG